MLKEHNLSKKISDASFYEIIRQLEYKSKYKDKLFYQIDTYYPSTQICSVCNSIDNKYKNLNISIFFHKEVTEEDLEKIINEKAEVLPIMSYNAYNLDTKFGKAKDYIEKIQKLTGKEIIHTIQEAEPIGPKKMFDICCM